MYLLPHLDGCECCEDRNFPRRAARLPAVFTTEIDVPDLSDPATLGCLLHLVRQAYGDSSLQPNDAGEYDMLHWHVFIGPHFACTGHATEAEALVAALEAAP
jgi:hypothetical protein